MLRSLLFLLLCLGTVAAGAAGNYRAVVGLDSGWPRRCGSAVSIQGWDIQILRERVGDDVAARVEVRPPTGGGALPVLARLEIGQFRPAVLLVPNEGLLTLPGFEADARLDWATLMRNFMFFGGTLVLGQVGGDIEIPFTGPAPRDVTAQYLNCSGDLAAPLRGGS
ncbi:hypothetical protein [Methyloversatilis sp.]|uniref:hypothetical protein n=1 Tax=Methyloversatilis sp. TaxID=2569862 RepID=UPI002734ACC3|nr:hypothetical protein [Methyloversatilis sp.]MDP2870093.1 hypothetical protein [Methyloversatilis sp.]MDP3456767.1 hypothetical protein [Methyloversatilis sp.]MDP3580022.1 hypothetical protein [Methyloversatilis sp.]